MLPDAVRQQIVRFSAPSFRNFQITLTLRDFATPQDSYAWIKSVNDSIKQANLKVAGRDVYVALELPEWKRQRNRAMKRAESSLASVSDVALKLDYPNGSIWATDREMQLGYWHKATSAWRWCADGLRVLGIDQSRLEEALAAESS
jgi:hypothetical protein